jgi:RNA polymerase sigma-70 factor (ECF subfamily)
MDRSASGIARCIRLAREGQPDALSTLLEGYRNYLRLMAATCIEGNVRAKADPSDLVQETLLRAHENFHQFRGTTEGEWVAWVRRILARNVAQLQRRFSKARRRVNLERSLETSMDRSSRRLGCLVPARGPSPSEDAQQRELSVVLADALAELEHEEREVVILRNLRELDWKEIGAQTGRTPDAARMVWTRALRRMAPLLKERMS